MHALFNVGESVPPADESESSESSKIRSDSQNVCIEPEGVSGNSLIWLLLINIIMIRLECILTLFAENCDRLRPTPKELRMYVRNHVQDKWEELADELGLDDDDKASEELEKIREKWKTDKKNSKAAFNALKLWLRHYQIAATWQVLLDALRKLKLDSAVSSIQDYLSGSGKY